MPASPSMKVMALSHAPVLPKPGSSVIAPVSARSLPMSMPISFSVPSTTGSSTFLSLTVIVAVRAIRGPYQGVTPKVVAGRNRATGAPCYGLREREQTVNDLHQVVARNRRRVHDGIEMRLLP